MNLRDHLILYVDDERPNRIVFEQSFKEAFRIKTAASGEEALAVLAAEPVAVLITDQRMPMMSGHELLTIAKARHPEAVRVVITAYSDLDPILRAVNDGLVARYLIKPWERAELEQILLWAIQAHVLGREDSAFQVRLMQTERLATLGSISSALVHDLTEPLASLDHNCDRLAQLAQAGAGLARDLTDAPQVEGAQLEALRDLVGELGDIAEESKRSCGLMLQMTDSIRQFGRPATPQEARTADPSVVLRQVLAMARDLARRRNATLTLEAPAALPEVRIAAVELTQVLLNLIINATQAIERGGRPGRVSVAAAADGKHVEVTVRDDGVGIAPDVLARVGTPFFTTRPDGSGLGISQCLRLVGRADGVLSISSVEGSGTIVTIRLPR